jgi:hypothetical protein
MTSSKETAGGSRADRARAFAEKKLTSGGATARRAAKKAGERVETYPVAALVGGLAIGAAVGVLLPRTRQEEQLLGSLGETINERARGAVFAARDAGQSKLEELGISSDAAGKQVGRLIDSIAKVAESAGSAAIEAARR